MIFSKARAEHGCTKCNVEIKIGGIHLVKQRYGYGIDRYCMPCVMAELRERFVPNDTQSRIIDNEK